MVKSLKLNTMQPMDKEMTRTMFGEDAVKIVILLKA